MARYLFRTLTARVLLIAFILTATVGPARAHAPAVTSARALQDVMVSEPMTITLVAVSAAAGPAGVVVAGAVGLTAAGFAIAENWDVIESGLKSFGRWLSGPSEQERLAQAEHEAAARAERHRQAEWLAREAAAHQLYQAQLKSLEAVRADLNVAHTKYEDAMVRHVPSIQHSVRRIVRQSEAAGEVFQRSEAEHNSLLTAAARVTNELAEKTRRDFNEVVAKSQKGGSPPAGVPQGEITETHPQMAAIRPDLHFSTQPGDIGYDSLAKTDAYVRAGARSLKPGTQHIAERASHLGLAELAVEEADSHFFEGDPGAALEILQHVERVVDDIFEYDTMRDQVSAGSTFLAGMISGATGLPGQPLQGYARAWFAGRIVGAGLGLVADATALGTALAGGFGTGGLALASGGTLASAAAFIAGECASVVSLSVGLGGMHMGIVKAGVDELRNAGRPGGGLAPMNGSVPPGVEDLWVKDTKIFREGSHFKKHGRGMGYGSKKDYRQGALIGRILSPRPSLS